jgi:hypothetical protein
MLSHCAAMGVRAPKSVVAELGDVLCVEISRTREL